MIEENGWVYFEEVLYCKGLYSESDIEFSLRSEYSIGCETKINTNDRRRWKVIIEGGWLSKYGGDGTMTTIIKENLSDEEVLSFINDECSKDNRILKRVCTVPDNGSNWFFNRRDSLEISIGRDYIDFYEFVNGIIR